jgi:hypothetical protein
VRKHDGKGKRSRSRCSKEGVIKIYLKEVSLGGGQNGLMWLRIGTMAGRCKYSNDLWIGLKMRGIS